MARKSLNLEDVWKFTKKDWTNTADKSSNALRDFITKKKFFKNIPYTAEYRKRKQARKAAPKGVSVSSTSGVPDLTLTGKTMQALKTLKATTKSAIIGWTGSAANIIEANKKNGRDVEDPSLLKKLEPVTAKELQKSVNKRAKKINGRKVTIKVPIKL